MFLLRWLALTWDSLFCLAERYRHKSQQRNRQDGSSQQERRKRFRERSPRGRHGRVPLHWMIIHSVTTPGDAESLQIIFIFSSSARFLASFVQPAIGAHGRQFGTDEQADPLY